MTKMLSGAAMVALVASGAAAGIDGTQATSSSVSYMFGDEFLPMPVFDAFDDIGGTRVLESVTIGLDAALSIEVLVQNNDDADYFDGDWSAEVNFNTLFSIDGPGDGGGEEEGGGAFFGLGGISLGTITGPLSADDGVPGSGEDQLVVSDSNTINSVLDVNAELFGVFMQDGALTSVFGPFNDILVTQPDGGGFPGGPGGPGLGIPFPISGISVDVTQQSLVGTLSIEYGYSVVPAPAGAALVGVAGFGLVRRRR